MLFIALAAVTALEVLAIAVHRISRMAVVFVIALTQFIGLAVAYYGGLFGASIPIRFFFAGIFLSCLPAAVLSAYLLDGVRSARGLILLLLLGFGGFGLTWAMGLTFAPQLGFSPVESLPPSAAWLVFASATMAEVLGLVTVLALYIALGRRLHLPHWARTLCALALAPLANSLLVFLASLLLPQARGYYDLLGIAVLARAAMGIYMTPGVLVFLRAFPPALETDMASMRTRDALAQFLEVRRTLGEVEARYRALFEAAPNAIVLFGQDGIIREANARAAEMAGCRGNALVGMPVWELVTVADVERGPEAAVKARMKDVQPGGVVRLESMVLRADGTTLPVEINLARIGDAASLYVAVAHDLTRRKRDQEQLEKQISELNALAEMSHIAAVARDMPRLLKASVDRLGELVEADGCWITLWRGDKQQAVPAAACGPDHEGFRSLPAMSLDEGPSMTWAALSAGHPIVIQNFPESQYFKPRLVMGPAIQSAIVLPLIADERKLGAIVVGYHRPHAFGQEETTTLERAANVIALAIAKIHLLDETQERLRHVLVLNRIAEKLSATLDAREIFQTLADEIIETLRVRQCAALEGSEEKRSLTVTAGRLLPEVRFLIGHQFPADDFPTLESLGWTRGPIILDDANNDERLAAVRPLLEQGGVRSLLVVPLEARGQMLGALALDTTGREPFSPSELDLIVSIGHYAAAALENACMYAETVEREQVAESLRHVGAALASTLDYDEILDRILDNLTRVVQCDAANIQLIQRGAAQVIRSRGYEKLGLAVQMEDLTLPLGNTPLLQQIVETRQPLFVPDIRQEPRWRVPSSWGERPQFWRSWAGAPVIARGEVIGFVNADSAEPGTYTERHAELLAIFANQAAVALENARLYSEAKEQRTIAETLRQAGMALAGTLDIDGVLDCILELLEKVVPCDASNIQLIREGRVMLSRTRGYDKFGAEQTVKEATFVVQDVPNLRWMSETCLPHHILDTWNDPAWVNTPKLDWIRSWAGAPIVVRGEVIGFINVDSATPDTYSERHAELLALFASHSATALENALLYAETKEQRAIAETLRDAGRVLASTLNTEEILDRILELLEQVVPCDATNIRLVQNGRAVLSRMRGYEKFGSERAIGELTFGVTEFPNTRQMWESKLPYHIPDTRREPAWVMVPGVDWALSWAGAPLVIRGEVVGFLGVYSTTPDFYTERHAELLASFASHAATALENARLYEQAQRRLTELTAIYQVGQRLQTLHTTEALAQEVINALGESLGYDHGSVMLVEEATGRLVTFGLTERGRDAVFVEAEKVRVEGFGIRLGVGITGSVAQTGKSVRVGDVSQEPHYVAVRQDIRSELCVPMRVGDKVIGVINVESTRPDAYSDSDQRVLETIGTQVAVAIQNARLYEDLEKAYRQVKEAQEEAMRAERLRALGQMASGIAHDFNNVLMPIMGYLELVLENPDLPEEVRSDVERARRSALAASGIVARLREFYRPREAAEAFGPVDMSKVVLEAIDLTRPRWRDIPQEQGTVIDIHPELGDLPPVHGDANALRDMLTNLLINAVDAMPSGGVITIRTQRESTRALLTVSDTGVGMNAEARQRAFEPFFSTKGSRGTGLGLAVCYGTVQRHGGTIDLTSEPGIGTTFLIRLPLSSGTRPIGRDPDLPALPPLTILVVDDEEPVLTVVSRMLMRAGHSVIAASGGQEGIDQFRPGLVDVVITDLGMPGVTGRELARAIKSRSPQTPIILLTGWGAKVGAEPGAPEEMDAILSKPVNSNELHRALAKVLGLLKEE